MNNKTKTAIKWIIAATAFMLVAVIVAGLPLGWFGKKEEATGGLQETVQAGGMIVDDETEGAGISLMSAVIPVAQYEEYGISTKGCPSCCPAPRLPSRCMPFRPTP